MTWTKGARPHVTKHAIHGAGQDKAQAADAQKRAAAAHALTYVEAGMTLGLGTGSTAAHLVDLLGQKVAAGFDIQCVPTSEVTAAQARRLNIPLTSLDEVPLIDLTIDGADELDRNLRLIKGGGGALLREKIVATASERMLVIADETKLVATLGAYPLPVEVVPFGLLATRLLVQEYASEAGCSGDIVVRVAKDGTTFRTDSGNLILDCSFGKIEDPEALDAMLKLVPGVVENGLFVDIAWKAIIAGASGITELDAPENF
jgi:ribose 5-phosphate isomerase A